MLSEEYRDGIKHNKKMLLTILSVVRYLGRQGLAMRGNDDESNSNFIQTLDLDGSMKNGLNVSKINILALLFKMKCCIKNIT